MNDYDAIFRTLKEAGFGRSPQSAIQPPAWISIEDGVDGLDQLQRSVHFLRQKLTHHWH
jgi:sugar phosphate isomerase/epimerase